LSPKHVSKPETYNYIRVLFVVEKSSRSSWGCRKCR